MIVKKILMLGEIGVGKTSISRRLVVRHVRRQLQGDDRRRHLLLRRASRIRKASPFKFLVWDTDGSYGESIFRQYYARQAQAAMIVADVTRPSTVETMLQLGRLYQEVMPGRYFAHVLNKTDLSEDPAVAAVDRKAEVVEGAAVQDQRDFRRQRRRRRSSRPPPRSSSWSVEAPCRSPSADDTRYSGRSRVVPDRAGLLRPRLARPAIWSCGERTGQARRFRRARPAGRQLDPAAVRLRGRHPGLAHQPAPQVELANIRIVGANSDSPQLNFYLHWLETSGAT